MSHPNEFISRGLFFALRAVQDHEMAGNAFLRGLRQTHRVAPNLGWHLIERDEPTDLGPERAVEVGPLPSSLAWSGDGSEQARF
jgi:hypothetical protein